MAYVSWHCVLFSDGPFFASKDALGFDLTISDGEVVATVPDSWRRLGNERIDTRPTLQANSLLLRLFAENRLNDHKCAFKCISVLGHLQFYYKSLACELDMNVSDIGRLPLVLAQHNSRAGYSCSDQPRYAAWATR